jgi:hypothetical protein
MDSRLKLGESRAVSRTGVLSLLSPAYFRIACHTAMKEPSTRPA